MILPHIETQQSSFHRLAVFAKTATSRRADEAEPPSPSSDASSHVSYVTYKHSLKVLGPPADFQKGERGSMQAAVAPTAESAQGGATTRVLLLLTASHLLLFSSYLLLISSSSRLLLFSSFCLLLLISPLLLLFSSSCLLIFSWYLRR